MKKKEAARLAALRQRIPEFIPSEPPARGAPSPFELLYADKKGASRAFEQAKGRFFGHDIWQGIQPYAGRALAAARERKLERVRELGQFIEGGSIEGHVHALWALLARYDRLEDVPPWPRSKEDLDPDLHARLAARNKLLRSEVRSTCAVRLALLAGEKPAAKDCKNAQTDDLLAAEAALVLGDLATAEKRFRAVARNKPSWMTDMSKGDPRIPGLLGLARVARAKNANAMVFKHVDAALAIDPSSRAALALGIETAETVGLVARAKKYRAKLPKTSSAIDDARRAKDLYAFAETGDRRALEREARRMLKADPFFVSAREALAYALGGDKHEFERTGLRALFGEEHRIKDPRAWSKLPAREALSPHPVRATERANALLLQGFDDDAFAVLAVEEGRVAKDDPIRWLAAGALFRRGVLRSTGEKKKYAKAAWAWLEPLLKVKEKHALQIPAMVLAIQIAHTLGDAKRVVSVKVPYDATAYRTLTGRAHASVAPLIADAMIKLKRGRDAKKLIEEIWADAASERQNARLIEVYDRAIRATGGTGGALPTSADRAAARVFGDEELMRLSDEAWALERRGDLEGAIATYLAAAEAEPERASVGLGNAGNLLTKKRDYQRAWPFLETALRFVSGLSPGGRASVLSQVAFHFREQGRHAESLPSAMLAFELDPTAARAAQIAIAYRALGDETRADRWRERGLALEPRHPELACRSSRRAR